MSIELTDEELHDEMVEYGSKESHDYRFPNCEVNHWIDRCELCGAKPMTVNCNNARCQDV